MEINAIETAFVITNPLELEEVIYKSKTITPDQQSLLDGRNSHQYPVERELSERKVTNSASEKQGEVAESSFGKMIVGGKTKRGKQYEIVVASDDIREGVRKIKFETCGDN
ncbi:MAG: hypothetical protein HDR94_02390 [Bacteroides sp.]|nr:hypothetical protein [Bacteroides sp.]